MLLGLIIGFGLGCAVGFLGLWRAVRVWWAAFPGEVQDRLLGIMNEEVQ